MSYAIIEAKECEKSNRPTRPQPGPSQSRPEAHKRGAPCRERSSQGERLRPARRERAYRSAIPLDPSPHRELCFTVSLGFLLVLALDRFLSDSLKTCPFPPAFLRSNVPSSPLHYSQRDLISSPPPNTMQIKGKPRKHSSSTALFIRSPLLNQTSNRSQPQVHPR